VRRATGLALALCALAGCGDDDDAPRGGPPAFGHPPAVAGLGGAASNPAEGRDRAPRRARRVRCPRRAGNCRRASGRILYVERVDPDGDGDAHFVLLSRQSVTAPGLSVIDVARELRPHPLPAPGETLSAAGPVYEGSRGQLQVQAREVRVGG
jgi:hypothetical protein